MDPKKLEQRCLHVLAANNRGTHTVPAAHLYPHQWLWDSCFIAIGLRHTDIDRARTELLSLCRGQWSNGMLPHIIFANGRAYETDRRIWFSRISPFAPDDIATSGITQPPVLAEAVIRIGRKLPLAERRAWYKTMYPHVLAYHQWLYAERDPHAEGLVLQIHPYETGLDNTPPWTLQLREHHRPWWIYIIDFLHLENIINLVRRDIRRVPASQRISNIESLLYWDVIRRLRRKRYEIQKILHRTLFSIEDLTFNAIFIRANSHLEEMARAIRVTLPDELTESMQRTTEAFDTLWDPQSETYYSRDFITHELIKVPTIASLMPLYSGAVSKERAEKLVRTLTDHHSFWLNHPVPSVPLNSPHYKEECYWQGPSWINTNWMIIDGLRRYGYDSLADDLSMRTLEMVDKAGSYEYFSALDGRGLGSPDFSWTAALTVDIINS